MKEEEEVEEVAVLRRTCCCCDAARRAPCNLITTECLFRFLRESRGEKKSEKDFLDARNDTSLQKKLRREKRPICFVLIYY
jgi:hypothetical protein